jgi:hypothetical protein
MKRDFIGKRKANQIILVFTENISDNVNSNFSRVF